MLYTIRHSWLSAAACANRRVQQAATEEGGSSDEHLEIPRSWRCKGLSLATGRPADCNGNRGECNRMTAPCNEKPIQCSGPATRALRPPTLVSAASESTGAPLQNGKRSLSAVGQTRGGPARVSGGPVHQNSAGVQQDEEAAEMMRQKSQEHPMHREKPLPGAGCDPRHFDSEPGLRLGGQPGARRSIYENRQSTPCKARNHARDHGAAMPLRRSAVAFGAKPASAPTVRGISTNFCEGPAPRRAAAVGAHPRRNVSNPLACDFLTADPMSSERGQPKVSVGHNSSMQHAHRE